MLHFHDVLVLDLKHLEHVSLHLCRFKVCPGSTNIPAPDLFLSLCEQLRQINKLLCAIISFSR
jgi:hypothetical protein